MTSFSNYPAEFVGFPEVLDRPSLKQYLFQPLDAPLRFQGDVVKYTRLSTLIRMLENHKWYIGNPRKMNDKKELANFPWAQWKRIFYSCFAANETESIAMWSLYGRPWADGISITIQNDFFSEWMRNTSTVYYLDGHMFHVLPNAELSIVQVAYTNELSKDPEGPHILSCNGQQNHYVTNIFGTEADVYEEFYDPTELAGAVKDIAWSYENEIRIRCDVKDEFVPDCVFIDIPDYIINNMVITAGPMFYGNLEYRLGELYSEKLHLKYSIFCHYLQGMPCTEFFHTTDSYNTCCSERRVLDDVRSNIPSADQLSLNHYFGKGTFFFPEKGVFSIGRDEHLFQLDWFHDGNNIHLKNPVGKYSYNSSNIPSVQMFAYYRFNTSQTTIISDSETVLIINQFGRVAAISFQPENFEVNTRKYEMEYNIYMKPKIELINAEEYGRKQAETQNNIFQDPKDPLCGTWWDVNSKRCHMSIGKKEGRYYAIIDWASSASINTEWIMSGTWNYDWNGMLCSDEQCMTTSGFENGIVQVTTEYKNGSCKLILINNEILWEDAAKSSGRRCRFVKESV